MNLRNVLFFFCTLLFSNAFSQFEGEISYVVHYSSDDPSTDAFISTLPGESTLLFKGQKVKFEQLIAGNGKQVYITDAENKTSTLMLNFMGQPFQVKMTNASMQSLKPNIEMTIVHTEETKEILGYTCHKALALSNSDTLEVYYTKALTGQSFFPQFDALEGLPLDFVLVENGLRMHFVAQEVRATELSDEQFTIPDAVKEISFDKFAKAFAERLPE